MILLLRAYGRTFIFNHPLGVFAIPRPNAAWEKKYGKKAAAKQHRLSGADDVLSATEKLAGQDKEAYNIILMGIRRVAPKEVFYLLDMDDMQMFGQRISKAYHEWANNDYDKLMQGIHDRDKGLLAFIEKIPL